MALSQLLIHNFRNLEQAELKPQAQGFNFLYGRNGSGKTSCLEAIYYLGHRRSFRSNNADHLIRHNSDRFNIFGYINDRFDQPVPVGLERFQTGDFQVRVNGEEVSTISELASFLPTRLINVHSHSLLEGSPSHRRKYLDWGIFYQNQEFQAIWQRFKRLLKQRNAALRMKGPFKELQSWTAEFAEAALAFHQLRLSYFEQLLPVIQSILSTGLAPFFDLSGLSIDYRAGWDETQSYAELLTAALPTDLERGHTQLGPHRADLSFKLDRIPVKEVLSTGQQKLLVCGMIVAQGALLARQGNKQPIYLVDDLPAELDRNSRHWLINRLAEQGAQVFVTAVEQEAISEILTEVGSPVKMFHVKHGNIQETAASI